MRGAGKEVFIIVAGRHCMHVRLVIQVGILKVHVGLFGERSYARIVEIPKLNTFVNSLVDFSFEYDIKFAIA